jgi:hypothetical protein
MLSLLRGVEASNTCLRVSIRFDVQPAGVLPDNWAARLQAWWYSGTSQDAIRLAAEQRAHEQHGGRSREEQQLLATARAEVSQQQQSDEHVGHECKVERLWMQKQQLVREQ